MAPPYAPQTLADLQLAATQHGLQNIQVILDLDKKDLIRPASEWTVRHLIAYRLLIQPEMSFLPIFLDVHLELCPVCNEDDGLEHYKIDIAHVQSITCDTPQDLCQKTDGELHRLPGGFFWAALAHAARHESEVVEMERAYPRRERVQVRQEGFVSSATAAFGSSPTDQGASSPAEPAMSDFSHVTQDLDDDENEARRSKPEQVTVHLLTMFLNTALNLCLVQHHPGTVARHEIRARVGRARCTTKVAQLYSITAEDDGGIYRASQTRSGGWAVDHPFLAIVEAKRAFERVDFNTTTDTFTPVISNNILAQIFGEAVVAWKSNNELLRKGVFVIVAASTFIRLTHFRFGTDYLEYLDTARRGTQALIVEDPEKDVSVQMQSTGWLDLHSRRGREVALCHVLALVTWWDKQISDDDSGVDDISDLHGDDDFDDDDMELGE